VSYSYNGLGDRLSETANSQTTEYIMDLNAGLTQALSDGTNIYLYGAGRVAQYGANGPEYYLGDALGSVRQMVDANGNVTLGRTYKPYGEVLSSTGSGETNYGFTNEWTDASTGDVYLRARWYAPYLNRWVQPDSIVPLASQGTQAYDRYAYVSNNPLRYTDPSGHHVTCDKDENCNESQSLSRYSGTGYWKALIKDEYGITMSDSGGKKWTNANLTIVYAGLGNMNWVLSGNFHIEGAIYRLGEAAGHCDGTYCGLTTDTTVTFYTTKGQNLRYQNLYHETGHVLDNMPGHKDQYSTAVRTLDQGNPRFLTPKGYISSRSLNSYSVTEPHGASSAALQHPARVGDPDVDWGSEQWADIFANYVAGNINLAEPGGVQMYNFVNGFFH
jgi:RHS repeat-associated protein